MKELSIFNCKNCKLSGELPPEMGSLANIAHINLEANELTGELPSTLEQCAFKSIDLSDNQFTGEIPDGLLNGSASTLEICDLGGNQFSGMLPSSLVKCTALQTLDLAKNEVRGTPSPTAFVF
jgi:Leucine-rich repeat (LRR) protein